MEWKSFIIKFFGPIRKKISEPSKKAKENFGDAHRTEKLSTEKTKYFGSQSGLPKLRLIIGLDFGTAFTKVVIGESRVRYVVPFNKLDCSKSVYSPCILYIDNEGYGSLSSSDTFDKRYNLKIPLIEGNSNQSQRAEIIVYLALILRYTRNWLHTEHHTTYKGKVIDWYINIGLPTENYHDEKMVNFYCEVVRSAWYLSIGKEKISINDAVHCLILFNQVSANTNELTSVTERWLHPDKVNCFPEFAAMISGYIRSPRRKKDLHLLVDIGAGTVDVTVFNAEPVNRNETLFLSA